jgi:superfamily II DNA or RNA helicase
VPYGSRPADVVCNELVFVSAAARIADAMARDALVAPLEGTVIPLPHQVHALARAMSSDRVRYLLADEVGLGKTVEAGLIFRELKIRGLVRRALVVAPAGLVTQWVQELKTHFDETFRLVIPSDLSAVRELVGLDEEANAWRLHDQVVCPLDSVKPLDARRGWTREQVARFNRERFDDLVSAGWDLIIIDEAHRLGGSTDQVARFRLGEALGQAAPYLLLLSATPHQGKTDGFRRLISFLGA